MLLMMSDADAALMVLHLMLLMHLLMIATVADAIAAGTADTLMVLGSGATADNPRGDFGRRGGRIVECLLRTAGTALGIGSCHL